MTQLFSGDVYQFCYMALIPNLLLMFEARFSKGWFDFLTLVLATEKYFKYHQHVQIEIWDRKKKVMQ